MGIGGIVGGREGHPRRRLHEGAQPPHRRGLGRQRRVRARGGSAGVGRRRRLLLLLLAASLHDFAAVVVLVVAGAAWFCGWTGSLLTFICCLHRYCCQPSCVWEATRTRTTTSAAAMVIFVS
jgi:hypothetical protein